MRIEYFGSPDDQPPAVVLIYGDEPGTVAILREAAQEIAAGVRDRVVVHDLPGFESVEGCKLSFSVGVSDLGVVRVGLGKTFEFIARRPSWAAVVELLGPFCGETSLDSFQYLDGFGDFESNVALIISAKGFRRGGSGIWRGVLRTIRGRR
jgi:hypothetical protein